MEVEFVAQRLPANNNSGAYDQEARLVVVKRPAASVNQVATRRDTWQRFGRAKLFAEANNNNNLRGITETSKEDVVIEVPVHEQEWAATLAKRRSAAEAAASSS